MSTAVISPEALQDLRDIHDYIALDDPGAATRVIDACEETVSLISNNPEIGVARPRLRNLRSMIVTEFPNYLVFYRLASGRVEIVRVLHGARDLHSILTSR